MWEVIIESIGMVYQGNDEKEALKIFNEACETSDCDQSVITRDVIILMFKGKTFSIHSKI